MDRLFLCLLLALSTRLAWAHELHVAIGGSSRFQSDGSLAKPFRLISAAAQVAQPGDTITVHGGTYRERITPPQGGESNNRRITYQAAPGERVVVKGSEIIRSWVPVEKDVWKVTLPNTYFGSYNPYQDVLDGDWYNGNGWSQHTGEVYLNGKSLYEVPKLDDVLNPQPKKGAQDSEGSTYTWSCESDAQNTTIYANFHGQNPNRELVEINVRESCFYPDQPGRNYITVRGFTMSQAATQWAAPTAEQIGLIGTHWSKGWIIENNTVSDSKCVGISLGKDRASGHNAWRGSKKSGNVVYNEVILKAIQNGWAKANIGSHLVQNNTVFNCEQAGIAGSMGGAFSQIIGNHVYDIYTKRLFGGAEMGGIKLHGAVDVLIEGNRVHNAMRGLWMDWMAQGTRITRNLLYENSNQDLYAEVNHGPFLVDNNLFLSATGLWDMSEGGAYAHNLFAGQLIWRADANRATPFLLPHSTSVAGVAKILDTDNRFYNNVFVKAILAKKPSHLDAQLGKPGFGLAVYGGAKKLPQTGGNLYFNGAQPLPAENGAIVQSDFNPHLELSETTESVEFKAAWNEALRAPGRRLVTTELLGKTDLSQAAFENSDGSPLQVDTDYFGKQRSAANLAAGPFAVPANGSATLKVWPVTK